MKYLRVANVYADKILTDNVHEIGVTKAEARKIALKLGDLLVVEGNGSINQIGRVAMWNGELPVCGHQNHLIRVRIATGSDSRFVLLAIPTLSPRTKSHRQRGHIDFRFAYSKHLEGVESDCSGCKLLRRSGSPGDDQREACGNG